MNSRSLGSREDERGSILPLIAVVLAVAVGIAMLLAALADRAIDRAEAQTAADMAALAAVYEGRAGAEELTERNGARLVAFTVRGDVVEVSVAVDRAEASARAELVWEHVPILD